MLLSKVGRPDRFPSDPIGHRPWAGAIACLLGARARSFVLLLFRDHYFGRFNHCCDRVALLEIQFFSALPGDD